ncbi:MAG: hypothetical protein ACRCWQ_10115 [Bacilli bacterium]
MLVCEWKDFQTDNEFFTKEKFERLVDDEFEAMMLDEHGFPQYIWTDNYVVLVTVRSKIIDEIAFDKIQRNPVCK